MNLRHFENTARKSFWVIHVEAWRQSGLARTTYCRHHHLNRRTFERWLDHLMGKEAARKHAESQAQLRQEACPKQCQKGPRRRQRQRFGVSTDVRNRALRACWAMHVEAMNWSGMGVREYAAALQLSPYALRRWRDRLEDGEVEIDWRAHLHPAARPTVSDITNGATSENSLTAQTDDTPAARGRRFFTDAQKLTVVQESEAAGATVSAVARRHGIATGILFRWRAEFGVAQKKQAKLASVTLATDAAAALALQNLVRPRVELDTNPVERAIRPVALGRKNHLFAGSDGGGDRWAIVCSLIETAKLNDVEPYAYLADVLQRMLDGHPISGLDELLPWAWKAQNPVKS